MNEEKVNDRILSIKKRVIMWHKALKNRIGKKRGRTLTIMAISTGDESVKSLSIPILWMYAGLALIIGVSVFLASSYLGMSAKVARFYVEHVNKDSYIAQLSKENAVLSGLNRENERRLQEIRDKLVKLETDLAFLDSLSGEITGIVKGTKSSTSDTSLPSRGDFDRGVPPGREAVAQESREIIPLASSSSGGSSLLKQTALFSETADWLDALQSSADNLGAQLDSLKKSAVSYRDRLDHTPRGIPTKGRVTSYYGTRRHPITGRSQLHQGVDLAAPKGTGIVATADGVVKFAGSRSGYGLTVIIDHGYGFQTLYGHCSKLAVRVGQQVKRGQVIAYVGSSGVSTGSHLHYEVRVSGKPVNPWPYMMN
ncbi:MAG TPA: M23 family metallopeptidase [Bacillota bacterium]|jgi:murein DD-endopeptidase MepM/ murein hydrolase activator NlpD|nr:M23 family metallopeptidase [Bacillota bacterium]HPU61082.1 M23 family metallopeptidase [Bacillota bacterium]HPZ92288.1 M23 family metallopeptidase [Bacillota bacterium]HQE03368.1 M23 family metallopeptidase [Bacillota bacterium]HQE04302.1 M23 family metallopeptidase [Bacillota bacterium]